MDTIWQEKFHQVKVKSIREAKGFNGNKAYFTGHIHFDKRGKVMEFCLPDKLDFQQTSFTYDAKGRRIKTVNYDLKDTSKIISQEDIKFDESGNVESEVKNILSIGKWTEEKTHIKILQKTKDVRVKEETHSRDGKIYNITLRKDSISDRCNIKFHTTIELRQEDSPDESNYIPSTEEPQIVPPPSTMVRQIEWRCSDNHITYSIRIESYGEEKT